MSKMEGKKIGIKFSMPLLGDVTGNTSAFTVTGQEYLYADGPNHNGPLVNKTYAVGSVYRIPAEVVHNDVFTEGSLNTTVIKNGAIILAQLGG